jgi:hypothetical protein
MSGCSREERRASSGWAVEGKRERGRGVVLGKLGRGEAHAGRGGERGPERERELGCWALFPLLLLCFSFSIL